MRFKKVTAAILAAATLAGFTGCNFEDKKNIDAVIKVTDQYVEALSNFDSKGILELTNWDKDDEGYKEVEFYVGGGFITDTVLMDKAMECYSYIASTIEYSYEDGRITLEKDNATLKIQYKMVDWKTLFAGSYKGYDELMDALKSSKDTIIVKDTLKFEKVKGEWKLTKITNLSEAFGFINSLPNMGLDPQPTIPDPTDEPAFPAGTQFADSYQKAIAAYLKVLDDNMAAITAVQETFRIDPVGIYDIDGNGIPELYFLACKDSSQVMNSSLFIYSYNENAGEALKQIEVPDIIYMAGSGGLFQIYATSNRLIITHAGGEDSDFKYWTEIYNFQWDLIASYRRNYLYDYNAPEDQATTVKYYEEEAEITEEQYNKVFKEDANNAVIVLARNYTPSPSDVEYPLVSKPSFAMLSYESAYTYIESLRS